MPRHSDENTCISKSVCHAVVEIVHLLRSKRCVTLAEMRLATGRSRSVLLEAISYLRDRGAWIDYNPRRRCYRIGRMMRINVQSMTVGELLDYGFIPEVDAEILQLVAESSPLNSRYLGALKRKLLQ